MPDKSNRWARALGVLIVILAITWGLGATAATLRSGSTSPQIGGDSSTGSLLSGSYDINENTGTGDNVIRLINPAGCGNGGVSNQQCGSETDLCAMIYVFDDDQEMGECCGCPVTPNQLDTFSVQNELTANWALATNDADSGVVQIVSGMHNNVGSCNPAHGCNGGCDPTVADIPSTSLIGSISRGQSILRTTGVTEVPLQNDGPAGAVESAYLTAECASLIGNGSGGGVCSCAEPTPTATPTATPTSTATATATSTPTATATPTPTATPFGAHVFVTTGTFNGTLGGTAEGSTDCQSEATSAGLPGTYKAWLSTRTTGDNPASSFTQSNIPYVLPDGTEVAANWTGLVSGTLFHAIDENASGVLEFGVSVWTGTTSAGAPATYKCQDWTSSLSTDIGAIGQSAATDTTWSSGVVATCDNALHLYCFEQ